MSGSAQRDRIPRTFPVVLAGGTAFVDLYATQPLLPLLARTFGASTFHVSLTVTASTMGVALAAPAVGRIADGIGRRRVIVGSAIALALATGLAASSASLNQLVFWRFLQGVFTPGVFAVTIAYIHEQWPAERAGRVTAAYVSGTVVGGFAGRVIAGIVAADVAWQDAFLVLALLNLLAATAVWIWLPPERAARAGRSLRLAGSGRHARSGQAGAAAEGSSSAGQAGGVDEALFGIDEAPAGLAGSARAVARHLRNPALLATYAVGFCVLFSLVAMFTYITFRLAAAPFFLSTAALGSLFFVYLIGAAITPFAGRSIDVHGHRWALGLAAAFAVTGAVVTLAGSLPLVITGLAIACTGVFIAQAAASSHVGASADRDRGLAVGLYATFYYVGGSLGAAVPATFWNVAGWPGCVAMVIGVQAVMLAFAWRFWTR